MTEINLVLLARRAMQDHGLSPDFPDEALAEVPRSPGAAAGLLGREDGALLDLRELCWSSIDNHESRDLDQIEWAERRGDDIRLLVGIADVDSVVPKGSAIDAHARDNTTSIYTGVVTFPMLPDPISSGLTSLLQDQDRLALVIETLVDPGGEVKSGDVYRARVRNRAKLAYPEIGAWLAGEGPPPAEVAASPELEAQLRLQDEAAQRLRAQRHAHGALELETIEARPIVVGGHVTALELTQKNRARELVEDLMIASNGVMARFLDAHHTSSIRRVVRSPERWSRIVTLASSLGTDLPAEPSSRALADFLTAQRKKDPVRFADLSLSVVKLMGAGEYALERPGDSHDGHFGLAVQDYTHSTAPNRRFADLVTQRMAKAVLAGAPPPYDDQELSAIALRCTERENDVRKVERTMRKTAAALLLQRRVGQTFDAIVTGNSPKGTYVRLLSPPAEGRVLQGAEGMDVGDRVRVRLLHTDPERGFIDFARA